MAPIPAPGGDVWLDQVEAAKLLSLTKARVSQLAADGTLKHHRSGRFTFFLRSTIRSYAAKMKAGRKKK